MAGSTPPRQTMNNFLESVNCHFVPSAPGHSQKKEISPGQAECHYRNHKLKYVKGVSSVTQLSCVQPVTNVRNAVPNLPVGARLQNFWQTWLDLGAGRKVVQILKEGPAKAHKVSRSHKLLCKSPQEQLPAGGIASAYSQKCCRTSKTSNISGVFQPTISSPKAQQQVEAHTRSEQTESFPQDGEIQNGDTGNHQNVPPTRGVGHLNRLQGCLLPYTDTGTVQEISEISCRGSDIPIQSTALWSVHSTLGVHCSSKGGETDGHTQGYKNPPVPRRLVVESQIPQGLYPTYSKSSENMSKIGLVGECRQVGTGSKADLRFCRLPVRPQGRSGPTDPRLVAEPSGQSRDCVSTQCIPRWDIVKA